MLRLFVTSNQISTVFCSTLAKKTYKEGYVDFLLIDNFAKKESLIELIHESSGIHTWNRIIDFSIRKSDDYDLKPGLWKRISRNVKHLPIIRTAYKFATGFYLRKKERTDSRLIFTKINDHFALDSSSEISLFLLTQTALNNGLINTFKTAVINYYEHGLVDYLYILKKKKVETFYVVFADSYKKYLQKLNISNIAVGEYFTREDMLIAFPESGKKTILSKNGLPEKLALIIMDSSEIFNVPDSFWSKYLEKCLNEISRIEQYTIVVKPHPGQANATIEIIKQFCSSRPNVILLSDPQHVSMSFERIYIEHKNQVDYVFSTYSAAAFYLASLFDGNTKFCFLYEFVKPYYLRGPKQYADAFEIMETYISDVFSSKFCYFLK